MQWQIFLTVISIATFYVARQKVKMFLSQVLLAESLTEFQEASTIPGLSPSNWVPEKRYYGKEFEAQTGGLGSSLLNTFSKSKAVIFIIDHHIKLPHKSSFNQRLHD